MPGSDSSESFAEGQPPTNVVGDVLEELLATIGWPDSNPVEAPVRPDVDRQRRKGVPEVILAESKRTADVLAASRVFVERTGRALLSRVDELLLERLRAEFPQCRVEAHTASRMVVIKRPDYCAPLIGGRVGVITAGTSDLPVAEEAAVVAAEMGCQVHVAHDVGVAGLHRLAEPLRAMLAGGVDVIVVAAGMDGALPSVVAGLVDVPVIGVPTSIGYGLGGKGLAALLSMLQTCSPGLTVVNIDNGVGAGASAGLIANRAAAARVRTERPSDRATER
jgi:pyridinium-3,5-biscarboxylic acid mononucleotide synthase